MYQTLRVGQNKYRRLQINSGKPEAKPTKLLKTQLIIEMFGFIMQSNLTGPCMIRDT